MESSTPPVTLLDDFKRQSQSRCAARVTQEADYSTYIEGNRLRLRQDAGARDRSHAALVAAKTLARRLNEELGARRVLLFGSLARGAFKPHSDIDLALEGVVLKHWYRALRLADAVKEFNVSLFPLEDATEHLSRQIASEGFVLWPE